MSLALPVLSERERTQPHRRRRQTCFARLSNSITVDHCSGKACVKEQCLRVVGMSIASFRLQRTSRQCRHKWPSSKRPQWSCMRCQKLAVPHCSTEVVAVQHRFVCHSPQEVADLGMRLQAAMRSKDVGRFMLSRSTIIEARCHCRPASCCSEGFRNLTLGSARHGFSLSYRCCLCLFGSREAAAFDHDVAESSSPPACSI